MTWFMLFFFGGGGVFAHMANIILANHLKSVHNCRRKHGDLKTHSKISQYHIDHVSSAEVFVHRHNNLYL